MTKWETSDAADVLLSVSAQGLGQFLVPSTRAPGVHTHTCRQQGKMPASLKEILNAHFELRIIFLVFLNIALKLKRAHSI